VAGDLGVGPGVLEKGGADILEYLDGCAATLAAGLNKTNGDDEDTDEAIRDAVNSVRTALK